MSLLADLAGGALDESYALAAGGRAGRRPGSGRLAVLSGLLLAGLLLATAVGQAQRAAPGQSRERGRLAGEIGNRTREVAGLGAALARLQQQVPSLRRATSADAARLAALGANLRVLAMVTGTAAISGPGLTLTLGDPPAGGRRVTDRDLQEVANALWAAGAEGVEINGYRLTARSAIRTAGSAILVDFRPVSPPYSITAVGDQNALSSGFAASAVAARLRSAATTYGGQFLVSLAVGLQLPAAPAFPGGRP